MVNAHIVGVKGMDYITQLIDARSEGRVSDHVHLGLFMPKYKATSLAEAQEAMSLHHLSYLDACDGETIVDVGSGFGGTLQILDRKLSDAHLFGVNIEDRQIDLARRFSFSNQVSWKCCDAASFSENEYSWVDRIISLEAFFHFPDPVGFFAASAQALRCDGRLVMSTLLLDTPTSVAALSRDVVTTCYNPWPFPDFRVSDLSRMAKDAGLYQIHYEDLGIFCKPSLDLMSPACPATVTDNPVVELRRLFEMGCVRYPLFVFGRVFM